MEFSQFSHDLHVKKKLRLFRTKVNFNIYFVLSVDQAFCEANACTIILLLSIKTTILYKLSLL